MHRDQKVGLALGVLLIGAVAAFFFRNETHPARRAPSLERATEVDREIAERKLTPYFAPKTDAELAAEATERAAAQRSDEPDLRTGERRLPSWDELQAAIDDPFAADAALDAALPPAPDPIPVEPSPAAALAEATVEFSAADVVAQNASAVAPTIHEVQRGDTLSSVAGKYLGSQAKFQEIFEANRDQLRDANDLQIGMKLRIPDGKPTMQTASRSDAIDATEATSAEMPEPIVQPSPPSSRTEIPKFKFTPSKRRPLRGAPP
jgi:LysM repeat protein